MDVRFEDHAQLHRAAGQAAAGAAVAAMLAPSVVLVQAAVAGGAFAVAAWPGSATESKRRRGLGAIAVCLAAAASALQPHNGWLSAAAGGLLGLVLAAARDDAARESGAAKPSPVTVLLTCTLAAGAVAAASATLPLLAGALGDGWLATGAAGAATALWAVLATAPLHVRLGGDPVEVRRAQLRTALTAELRALADRAVGARREAIAALPEGARGDLRTLLDQLALAALDVAERAAGFAKAAPAGAEQDLARRVAELQKDAERAEDPDAAKSYGRAAEALGGQLEHLRRVRRARERAVARLHEEVAHLERARFALTLLKGADNAVELELLHDRLQHAAAPWEADTIPEQDGGRVEPVAVRAVP